MPHPARWKYDIIKISDKDSPWVVVERQGQKRVVSFSSLHEAKDWIEEYERTELYAF